MAELCPEAGSRSVQDGPGIHLPFPYHAYLYEMLLIIQHEYQNGLYIYMGASRRYRYIY